jgi:hypothetical protein
MFEFAGLSTEKLLGFSQRHILFECDADSSYLFLRELVLRNQYYEPGEAEMANSHEGTAYGVIVSSSIFIVRVVNGKNCLFAGGTWVSCLMVLPTGNANLLFRRCTSIFHSLTQISDGCWSLKQPLVFSGSEDRSDMIMTIGSVARISVTSHQLFMHADNGIEDTIDSPCYGRVRNYMTCHSSWLVEATISSHRHMVLSFLIAATWRNEGWVRSRARRNPNTARHALYRGDCSSLLIFCYLQMCFILLCISPAPRRQSTRSRIFRMRNTITVQVDNS